MRIRFGQLFGLSMSGSARIVGFAGSDETIGAILANAPSEPMRVLHETEKEVVRIREEVALPVKLDDLFDTYRSYRQVE
jgi:hypothetical protein